MSNSTDLIAELDYSRFDALDGYPKLGSSYWTSIMEAALRCKRLTVEMHCRQIASVGREACVVAKMLGAASDNARCSA